MILGNNTLSQILKKRGKDPLAPLVDEYLLRRDNEFSARLPNYDIPLIEHSFRPPGRLSPSSIGKCKRKAVLQFVGLKAVRLLEPALERTFQRGNWIHHEWYATILDMQRVLGKDKLEVLSIEESITIPDLYIRGRLDARVSIQGEPSILDVKSTRSYDFKRRLIEGADSDHRLQVHAYMMGKKYDLAYILYDNKEDQSGYRCYRVDFEKDYWEKIRKWGLRVLQYVEDKVLPPIDSKCYRGSSMAKSCPYAAYCYSQMTDDEIGHKAFTKGKRSLIQGVDEWWEIGKKIEKKNRLAFNSSMNTSSES